MVACSSLALLQAVRQWCEQEGVSSVHMLFASGEDVQTSAEQGLMLRRTVQFHWKNVAPTLATACAALPPKGAFAPWGGPAALIPGYFMVRNSPR